LELGKHFIIFLKTPENHANVRQRGRPEDLPDAFLLLLSSPETKRWKIP